LEKLREAKNKGIGRLGGFLFQLQLENLSLYYTDTPE